MIQFKRDIYKLKAPPKPTKLSPQTTWYRSEAYEKGTLNYCLPINIPVYKNPNTSPILVGQTLYTDFQQTSALTPQGGGTDDTYNISTQSLTNPSGVSGIEAVQINGSGVIIDKMQGDCNPPLNLESIYITEVMQSRTVCFKALLSYEVKVDSLDLNNGIIDSSAQLYEPTSTNSNPQQLNPNSIPIVAYFGFDNSASNYIGVATTGSFDGDSSISSMEINLNGFVNNPDAC